MSNKQPWKPPCFFFQNQAKNIPWQASVLMIISCKFDNSICNTLGSRRETVKCLHNAVMVAVAYSCINHSIHQIHPGGYKETCKLNMSKTMPDCFFFFFFFFFLWIETKVAKTKKKSFLYWTYLKLHKMYHICFAVYLGMNWQKQKV